MTNQDPYRHLILDEHRDSETSRTSACRLLFVIHYVMAGVAFLIGASAIYPSLRWADPLAGLGILVMLAAAAMPVAILIQGWRSQLPGWTLLSALIAAVAISFLQCFAILPLVQ